MFSTAVPIASGFTRPLVLSSRTTQGECRSTIGAYVVLNAEGWILTAGHLLEIVRQHRDSARRHRGYRDNVVEFQLDTAADKRFRKRGVRTFHRPAGASVRDHSVWWGADDMRLVDARMLPAADLALGRLEPFDPARVPHYPVLKDPNRDYVPGRSLCKLGFPFQSIVPVYDEKANAFTLPPGSVPLALFPLEGMFTRIVNTRAPGSGEGETSAFIETSTPTLIGQMGGPVFDADARMWGIQSHTMHYPARVPSAGSGRRAGAGGAPVPQYRARRACERDHPVPGGRGHRVPARGLSRLLARLSPPRRRGRAAAPAADGHGACRREPR